MTIKVKMKIGNMCSSNKSLIYNQLTKIMVCKVNANETGRTGDGVIYGLIKCLRGWSVDCLMCMTVGKMGNGYMYMYMCMVKAKNC